MTLIQSAPARICNRVARRTASAPSAMPGGRSLTSVSRIAPEGVQPSPCPPVWESGVQLTCVRGPGKAPLAKARLIPAGVYPASRIVVTPDFEEVAAGLQGPDDEVRGRALDLIGDRLELQAQVDVAVDDAGQDREPGNVDPLGPLRWTAAPGSGSR